ncbi:MAG: hypothetical protein ABJE66_30545 [Deltaproteobacteria bacterium]
MKRLPHALVAGMVLELLSSLVFLLVYLKSRDLAFGQTWTMVMNGIDVAAHVLAAAGAVQLAGSLTGRAAVGAKIAAAAQLALVVMVGFWIGMQLWTSGDSATVWKVVSAARYVHAGLWLAFAVGFALVARPVGLAIALPVVAVFGVPLPVVGRLLYSGIHSETASIAIETVPYIVLSVLALEATWSRRMELVERPAADAADAFTRAGKALWLRVIAALSLAGLTFLVGMSRSADLIGLLRAVMLLAPIVDAIALALFARAVIALVRTPLAPWLLSAAAAFALAAIGMVAGRIAQLYDLFYGHHSEGLYGMAAREPVLDGLSTQVVPLVAATAITLVLVVIGRIARDRNLEDVRENIVIRTGVFVALMLGAMLMTHFLGGSTVGEAGVAVFMLFAIAGATLYALTIAAKLCAQGAELVALDPVGLPAAKVVSS